MYPVFLKKDIPEEFRVKTTKKAQKNLNNKNAVKHFIRKVNANFGKGDYYLTLNYRNDNRPKSYEEAKKHVRAYINKLNYEYMKLQVHQEGKKLSHKINKKKYKKIKYMYVIEISKEGKGKYHVHMIMSSELTMDQVENCWKYGRRNNIRRIDPDEKHLTDLANYLSKDPKGKKRWGCSQGLKEPIITTSKKVSKRKIFKMESDHNLIEKEMEKFILKTDKFRGDYYHYYTGRTWNDARNYDLCLDSSKLGFEKCVEAIKDYVKIRFDR